MLMLWQCRGCDRRCVHVPTFDTSRCAAATTTTTTTTSLGPDGCVDLTNPDNNGLAEIIATLEAIRAPYCTAWHHRHRFVDHFLTF